MTAQNSKEELTDTSFQTIEVAQDITPLSDVCSAPNDNADITPDNNKKLSFFDKIKAYFSNEKTQKNRNRIWEIDFLRGLCVMLMILDHLAILLSQFFARSWYGPNYYIMDAGDAFSRFCYEWTCSKTRTVIHPIVLFFFLSISGISCTFSRSNLKRGLQLSAVALIYTLCSYIAQEVVGISSTFVAFGVLHFLAVCVLLYALIEFICKKNKIAILSVSFALIITVLCLYFLYTPPATTPKFFAIIFPPKDFYGNPSPFYRQELVSPGDLFSLIPWMAFFFAGIPLANIFYRKRKSLLPALDKKWHKPISFIGRHALVIYLAHMLVLAGLLALISYLFVTPGSWGI